MPKILLIIVGSIFLLAVILWLFGERGKLIMPTTKKFIKMAGLRRFFNLSSLHGYIYLRLQKQYLKFLIKSNPTAPPFVRKFVTDHYHSKILTHDHATKFITLDKDIPDQNIEQIVPHHIARRIVLNASPKIVAFECGCRHARKTPCLPTQVCLFIGEPFADFMLEHHPTESRQLSQTEAIELLEAEHARGHLHSAWFKDAMMDRFYVICNCCKCCCGGIESMVKYGQPMMASSGYVVQSNAELCQACGTCIDICPFDALSLENDHILINWEKCMGCGVCIDKCPNKGLSLVRDEKKGVPLEVEYLTK
jgi:ferredoxin